MWVPVAVWQSCELLYTCYLLTCYYLNRYSFYEYCAWQENVTDQRNDGIPSIDTDSAHFRRSFSPLHSAFCITVPNFVKICQTVAEISRFLWFSRWRYISPICPEAPSTDLHYIWHGRWGPPSNHLWPQFFGDRSRGVDSVRGHVPLTRPVTVNTAQRVIMPESLRNLIIFSHP